MTGLSVVTVKGNYINPQTLCLRNNFLEKSFTTPEKCFRRNLLCPAPVLQPSKLGSDAAEATRKKIRSLGKEYGTTLRKILRQAQDDTTFSRNNIAD
jgi:hypothetical protein